MHSLETIRRLNEQATFNVKGTQTGRLSRNVPTDDGGVKAAAISKTSEGKEVVVAVFSANSEKGIEQIADRWMPCSGRLAPIPTTWGVPEAEAAHERGEL